MLRKLLPCALVLAFVAGQAQAEMLTVNYHSTTVASSLNGNPIPDGTHFTVHASFDSTPFHTVIGQGDYLVTGITAVVGGTPYMANFLPGEFTFVLIDPLSGGGHDIAPYVPYLVSTGYGAFIPLYTMATPAVSGRSASPTVFSGYESYKYYNTLFLSTSSGDLVLSFGNNSPDASITDVPEPSTLSMALLGSLVGIAFVRRRHTSGGA